MTACGQAKLVGISLDCPDPQRLADFYLGLLGGSQLWAKESSVGIAVPGPRRRREGDEPGRAPGLRLLLQRGRLTTHTDSSDKPLPGPVTRKPTIPLPAAS